MFCKNGVVRNLAKFTGNTCARVSFFDKVAGLRAAILCKKKALAQMFSCEFCEISKDTFIHRRLLVAAFDRLIPVSLC